jgi:hypothetical protein
MLASLVIAAAGFVVVCVAANVCMPRGRDVRPKSAGGVEVEAREKESTEAAQDGALAFASGWKIERRSAWDAYRQRLQRGA